MSDRSAEYEGAPTHARAAALPERWVGEYDLSTMAEVAALAYEYAGKVEDGTATWTEIVTLSCHCKVLAEDLYELASRPNRPHIVSSAGGSGGATNESERGEL